MESRSWIVKYWKGSLYTKRAHCVSKLKNLRFPNRISLAPYACTFANKDFLGLSVKPRAGGGLDVMIDDLIFKSSFSFPFEREGFYCITQAGAMFTCAFLKELSEVIIAQPMKWQDFRGVQYYPQVVASRRKFHFNTPKKCATSGSSTPAAVLFNDGAHLYIKDKDGELKHMLFRYFSKDVPANFVSGFAFPEPGVLFKTLGHTLSKNVIVLLRHHAGNWNFNLSIGSGFTATVYDHGGFLQTIIEK